MTGCDCRYTVMSLPNAFTYNPDYLPWWNRNHSWDLVRWDKGLQAQEDTEILAVPVLSSLMEVYYAGINSSGFFLWHDMQVFQRILQILQILLVPKKLIEEFTDLPRCLRLPPTTTSPRPENKILCVREINWVWKKKSLLPFYHALPRPHTPTNPSWHFKGWFHREFVLLSIPNDLIFKFQENVITR